MDWYTRRKVIYALGLIIFVSATSVYLLRDVLFPKPSCFDKKQNGFELGVDCGSPCELRCTSEVSPLTVLWARALKISTTTYDLVAMVSNKNIDNASHKINYKFVFHDVKGQEIGEIEGDTLAPTDGDFPVIRQSVVIEQAPHNVIMEIVDEDHFTVHEKPTSPTVRVGNEKYEPGSIPKLLAQVMNMKRVTISNLVIRAVLYDEGDNVYAVGETVVPFLDKEEVRDISFTWREPLPFSPTRIRIYPIFDPFGAVK